MRLQTLTTTFALAGVGVALPTRTDGLTPTRTWDKRSVAATIVAIMPSSASCAGRGDECTTAEDAVEYLTGSMTEYSVTTAIEQAGLLSLIAYESVEMQYKKNLDQSAQTGRGTVNMQSGDFNVEFAAALGLGTYTVDNVLDLTSTSDKFTFYSAAWYYTTQSSCSATRSLAQSGNVDADTWFDSYLTTCDGMGSSWNTSEPERWTYWTRAKEVFGIE
ncbi:hypothetical protein N0V93_009558 [Gnomoniopsis smithogilvyi]|uniref:Uncharacterized protein n=1 Tax=Gnomoniopsis smithogilvyi TaxID=1191159 RepID=A0A9W8YN18_9PEZI|nr:hypothetical protein N0V93_009558 [Gnomoniopsis smithogilvyi]